MPKILSQKYFNKPTLKLAKELLGKFLVRRVGDTQIEGMITEVEAYVGPEDKASHASKGKTKRTEVVFGKAGYWYVYMIYGMYYCLNFVTRTEEHPEAILIRALEIPHADHKIKMFQKGLATNGPGKLCRHFGITKKEDGLKL